MKRTLLCNLDLLRCWFDGIGEAEQQIIKEHRNEFVKTINRFIEDDIVDVLFYSRDVEMLDKARIRFSSFYPADTFVSRKHVEKVLSENKKDGYIIIGRKDADLYMSVRYKILWIVPGWIPCEDKAKQYGIMIDSPSQMNQFLRVFDNQNTWFSKCKIDDKTILLSLMDARYKFYAKSSNEREMLLHFEKLLKLGESRSYLEILKYHFFAGMSGTNLFDDIELFGMIPSSDCSLNPDVFTFMQQMRYILGKRLPHNSMDCENLLMRLSPKEKAHNTSGSVRVQRGPENEFSTLCINPEFRDKIIKLKKERRFNVCIIDDYVTYGNSFNAIRNIFKYLDADKLIFVSLGNFGRHLELWDYEIHGNVFHTGYRYRRTSKNSTEQELNTKAKQEVTRLYSIFNNVDL